MFDDALLESRRKRTWNGKRFSLPLALGFHAAVVGALVGASAWFTGEAPEPVIAVVFPGSSAPPPPPGGGEIHRTPPSVRRHTIQAMVQPVAIPVEVPTPIDDVAPAQPGPGDSGSEAPGPAATVPGGTGPSTGSGLPGAGGPEAILTPGGDVRAPALTHRVEPEYPEAARKAGLEGIVILEAIITASGPVQKVRVLKPLNSLLDEAAMRAVRQWRYRPATLNARAVPVYLTVSVTFQINR